MSICRRWRYWWVYNFSAWQEAYTSHSN